MSKPFSYNDKNFTVIDNILFVHFVDNKAYKAYEPVIPVPDKIYQRMASYGNIAFASPTLRNNGGISVGICIILKNKIPYIAFSEDITSSIARRYYSFYLLAGI